MGTGEAWKYEAEKREEKKERERSESGKGGFFSREKALFSMPPPENFSRPIRGCWSCAPVRLRSPRQPLSSLFSFFFLLVIRR